MTVGAGGLLNKTEPEFFAFFRIPEMTWMLQDAGRCRGIGVELRSVFLHSQAEAHRFPVIFDRVQPTQAAVHRQAAQPKYFTGQEYFLAAAVRIGVTVGHLPAPAVHPERPYVVRWQRVQ